MTLELNDAANVGGRIRWLREQKKMGQKTLGSRCGMSQSSISDIEKLRSGPPNAVNLLKIAAALDANPSWIATGQGDPFKFDPPPEEGSQEIANIYSALSPGKRNALMAAARSLMSD